MRNLLFVSIIITALSCKGKTSNSTNASELAYYAQEDFEGLFQSFVRRASFTSVIDDAQLFLDSAYVSKTLEIGNDSGVVVNICAFDCLTLVENVLAFHNSRGDANLFVNNLGQMRYRNGRADGYISRLHYFSEWILSNTAKGVVKDVTCAIGGKAIQFDINFMSTHPQYYPALLKDTSLVQEMARTETRLSQHTFCMIPKDKLEGVEERIESGDVLGIVTNIEGLDFAHNGFAIKKNGRLYMLHASSDYKRVRITDEPLYDYLQKMGHMTGVVVLRPQ